MGWASRARERRPRPVRGFTADGPRPRNEPLRMESRVGVHYRLEGDTVRRTVAKVRGKARVKAAKRERQSARG